MQVDNQQQQQLGEGESQQPPRTREESYHRLANQQLFSQQLEFISSLASPSFLTHLSCEKLLEDAAFLRYLSHLLETWSKPQFARFIRYPYSLYFLRCLQHPEFRETVGIQGWDTDVKNRLLDHWSTW